MIIDANTVEGKVTSSVVYVDIFDRMYSKNTIAVSNSREHIAYSSPLCPLDKVSVTNTDNGVKIGTMDVVGHNDVDYICFNCLRQVMKDGDCNCNRSQVVSLVNLFHFLEIQFDDNESNITLAQNWLREYSLNNLLLLKIEPTFCKENDRYHNNQYGFNYKNFKSNFFRLINTPNTLKLLKNKRELFVPKSSLFEITEPVLLDNMIAIFEEKFESRQNIIQKFKKLIIKRR